MTIMRSFLILIYLFPVLAFAQDKDFDPQKIEVWGSAERVIVPNEIYTSITIKEYKAPGRKITLDNLEEQLVKAVAAENIPKENLRVESIYGYNWDWRKKKSDEFLASKTFELKTSDVKKLNDLLERLDPEGLNRVNIKRYTHSDLNEIRRELQLEALKDAKAKAQNLLNGIGEALGGVLEVQEIQQHQPYETRVNMMARADAAEEYQSDVEFQQMRISATIRAVFEIY